LSKLNQLTEQFSHDHGISFGESANLLAEAYASGGVEGGLGVGVGKTNAGVELGAGAKRESNSTDSMTHNSLYQDAKQFVAQEGFSEQMGHAINAFENHQVHTGAESSNRLADQISHSLEETSQHRSEMQAHFQQSDNYRQMAQRAGEDSVNINTNASQAFFESYMQSSHQDAREAEKLFTEHPEEAQAIVKSFGERYTHKLERDWSHGMPASKEVLSQDYAREKSHIPGEASITQSFDKTHKDYQAIENNMEKKIGITDQAITQNTERQIADRGKAMTEQGKNIPKEGEAFKKTIQDKDKTQRKNVFRGLLSIQTDKENE
jgi:hypothetical protein